MQAPFNNFPSFPVTMTMRAIARGLLLLPLIASAAAAQYSNPIGVAVGTRVRIVAPTVRPDPTTGTVLLVQPDTIVLRSGQASSLAVPVSSIQKLEISAGRSRAKWGALGGVIGLFAGGIAGGKSGGHDDPTGVGALAGFFAGSVVGLGAGIIVGALAAPERWINYPLPSAH
jgi:hypothetical protein